MNIYGSGSHTLESNEPLVTNLRKLLDKMRSDISYHLGMVIKEYRLYPYFVGILTFVGTMSYLNYMETLILTSLSSSNYKQTLIKLVVINFAYKILLGTSKEHFQNKVFFPKYKTSIVSYLSKLMIGVDPKYLESQGKIHMIIPDGSKALENLGLNILGVIEPFFKITSSMIALGSKVKAEAMITIAFALGFFFTAGLGVLRFDYVGRKKQQTEINTHLDIIRNLWETYLVYYLNGVGSNTINEITIQNQNADKLALNHKAIAYSFYWVLDWVQFLLSAVSTYFVMEYKSTDIIEVFAMFYIISNVYNTVWWLFCTVRDTLTSTATWGTIELFIEEYEIRNESNLVELKDPSIIFSHFSDPNITELRLYAESGGGKTTWMSRKVVQLMKTYKDGGWLYLDQRMKLPQDQRTIRQVMFDYIYKQVDNELFDITLCKYANLLGLSNIINPSNLESKFNKPSGGEEKRILTLRAFLPILLELTDIKIIFNDEITAGLDYDNWVKVRKLIQELKSKGIKFVTIDHHDFDAPKLQVKKKTYKLKSNKISKSSNDFIVRIGKYFTNRDDKTDEKPEGVLVWIDGLETEPVDPVEPIDQIENTELDDSSSDPNSKLLEMV